MFRMVRLQVEPTSNGAISLTPAAYGTTLEENEQVGTRIDLQTLLSYSDVSDEEYPHTWTVSGTGS